MNITVWRAIGAKPWRFGFSRWPWLTLFYLFSSAMLGLVLLPVITMTFVFIPLWGLAVGALERRRVKLLGFARIENAHVRVGADERHNWLNIRMTEAATWRDVGGLFATLLMGWLGLALLVVEAVVLAAIVAIVASATHGPFRMNLSADVSVEMMPSDIWKACAAGLIALAVAAYVNAILVAGQASLSRFLLSPRQAELERYIERLTRSRVSLVEAFEQERRRIERDLHDGVQQELVALSVRLGLAEIDLEHAARSGANVQEARQAVAGAHDHTEHALRSLRATVRGIHPAVLTDHGLAAALQELAGRAGLPIEIDATLVQRASAASEGCAYFTVSEAITNAVKHSSATAIHIAAQTTAQELIVTVTDNGHGGADETLGTGIRGLKERAETLGGALNIDSPPGGPTMLRLRLPATTTLTAIAAG
ncbi:histidine kinase [Cryobacterium sp. Y57]|uniref:sensor histidine kinase n=1 Tax=Cryobacterium sp. Y57 TaxID=2048287 RepID=UPI000CE2B95C|nr:histidine kinase [Cryobacterium sp. Y57]